MSHHVLWMFVISNPAVAALTVLHQHSKSGSSSDDELMLVESTEEVFLLATTILNDLDMEIEDSAIMMVVSGLRISQMMKQFHIFGSECHTLQEVAN